MKKKFIITIIVVILLILLVPIPNHLKDGGTVEYKALTYNITKVHALNESSPTGYDEGLVIKLFGKTIYNSIKIYTEENNLKLEDIVSEDGLIFKISRNDKDCIPMILNVYEDGTYRLTTTYEACRPWQTCTMMLKYLEDNQGKYDYDVTKIINHSKKEDISSSSYEPKYEIFIGKDNQRYVTGTNNEYLEEFLKSINMNLDKCAKKEYIK